MIKFNKVLIDADQWLYAAGFAVEKKVYDVFDFKTSGVIILNLSNEDFKKAKFDTTKITVKERKVVEPVHHAYQIIKTMASKVQEKFPGAKLKFYLSGEGNNFREEIATLQEYKGNRDPDAKPVYFKELRQYIIDNFDTSVSKGIEADDLIVLDYMNEKACGSKAVIVRQDKDFNQVPGWHYDWKKGVLKEISPEQAVKEFFIQLLMGDNSDNIKGCWKVGIKKATKLVDQAKSYHGLLKICLRKYKDTFGKDASIFDHELKEFYKPHKFQLIENARLLYLLTDIEHVDDRWAWFRYFKDMYNA